MVPESELWCRYLVSILTCCYCYKLYFGIIRCDWFSTKCTKTARISAYIFLCQPNLLYYITPIWHSSSCRWWHPSCQWRLVKDPHLRVLFISHPEWKASGYTHSLCIGTMGRLEMSIMLKEERCLLLT